MLTAIRTRPTDQADLRHRAVHRRDRPGTASTVEEPLRSSRGIRRATRTSFQLVSRSYKEGSTMRPRLTEALLESMLADGLLWLSGCESGLLASSLVGGDNIRPEDASFGRVVVALDSSGALVAVTYLSAKPSRTRANAPTQPDGRSDRPRAEYPDGGDSRCHYTLPTEKELQRFSILCEAAASPRQRILPRVGGTLRLSVRR
jgi:hypothetical protein